jgi:hypothetical protein
VEVSGSALARGLKILSHSQAFSNVRDMQHPPPTCRSRAWLDAWLQIAAQGQLPESNCAR